MQTEDWSLFWLIYTFKYSWPMNWEGPLTHGGFWWICESEVAQSCPTPCDPMNCSLPGSSVHRIFQARILEWVALSFSRRSSQPRDWTRVSCIGGRCSTIWATKQDRYGCGTTISHDPQLFGSKPRDTRYGTKNTEGPLESRISNLGVGQCP